MFEEVKGEYEEALIKSGYQENLEYDPSTKPSSAATATSRSRKRKRKITWFNPPYNSSVETNIGQKFFSLLDHHFPRQHKLHKILNRNTVKLSYSCMPNVGRIIQATNKRILKNGSTEDEEKPCNCRNKTSCPLNGKCLTKTVVYEATLTTNNNITHKYIGLTENDFKERYNNHTKSFRNPANRNDTELAKKVWELKDSGTDYNIKWRILQKAQPYKGGSARCDVCLSEKLHILKNPTALNKRSELVSKCRHMRKFLLRGVK